VWLKNCIVLVMKNGWRILDEELFYHGTRFHRRITSIPLALHVNESRWRYRKDGYRYGYIYDE